MSQSANAKAGSRDEIDALAPWFHNLHLPGGRQTAPGHRFGDFPRSKWEELRPHLPESMEDMTALDIGCNAGFYSFALAELGAEVLGIDTDNHYLRQAEWAAREIGTDKVRFRKQQVYDLARTGERYDVVLFLGVLYHLRYPLLALDILARLEPEWLVFQSLTADTGAQGGEAKPPIDFDQRNALTGRDWPFMAFIEGEFAGDPTNWWAPSPQAVEALLRAAGFRVVSRPGHEIYICRRDPAAAAWPVDPREYHSATGVRPPRGAALNPYEEKKTNGR